MATYYQNRKFFRWECSGFHTNTQSKVYYQIRQSFSTVTHSTRLMKPQKMTKINFQNGTFKPIKRIKQKPKFKCGKKVRPSCGLFINERAKINMGKYYTEGKQSCTITFSASHIITISSDRKKEEHITSCFPKKVFSTIFKLSIFEKMIYSLWIFQHFFMFSIFVISNENNCF